MQRNVDHVSAVCGWSVKRVSASPYSPAGWDTRPSPERPGFESRWRNFAPDLFLLSGVFGGDCVC